MVESYSGSNVSGCGFEALGVGVSKSCFGEF